MGDPLKDLFSLRERINKLFEDAHSRRSGRESTAWTPVVDIYETPGEFIAKAELPGVTESDISIEVAQGVLTLSGEKRFQREGRGYHQVERSYGAFLRRFNLPAEVTQQEIAATLKNGILKIVVPKKVQESPKQIEIKQE